MKQNRPLSPHLTIYKPQVTSMFSIFHRVTGAILALFVLSQAFIITFTSHHLYTFGYYMIIHLCLTHYFWVLTGIFVFIFLAFHYHMANGIRHIIWDVNANTQLNLLTVIHSTRYVLVVGIILACVNYARIFLL